MTFYPPSGDTIATVMRCKGYAVLDDGSLNIFGIRSSDLQSNRFNDWVGVTYKADPWVTFAFPATTDPGVFWRENPMNVEGTAMLKPGQYVDAYTIGRHRGAYAALTQRDVVEVYRDPDRDAVIEPHESETDIGMFGINIHRAGRTRASVLVDRWSAGCQVVADPLHFEFLMSLAKRERPARFSYTLLTERDFQ